MPIALKPFTVNVKVYKQLKRHLLFLFRNISEFFLILSSDNRLFDSFVSLTKESKRILKYYEIKIINVFLVIFLYINV